jgi:hypothetical protein
VGLAIQDVLLVVNQQVTVKAVMYPVITTLKKTLANSAQYRMLNTYLPLGLAACLAKLDV